VTLSERAVRAERLMVGLDYAVADGCPDVAEFKAAVVARLGYDPFSESAPNRVLVRIEARGNAMDGHTEWRDPSGKWAGDQTFSAGRADCPRLLRAMEFALAIQIQLLARAAPAPGVSEKTAVPAEASPAPEASSAPSAEPTPAAPPEQAPIPEVTAVAPVPAGKARPVFAMGAGPALGLGMAPGPIGLARLFGTVSWQHLLVEAAAAASVPRTARRSDGAGFSQQHLLVSAAVCATGTRWSACLLAAAGRVRMQGENIERPTSASAPLAESGIRVGVVQPLGSRAFLGAHADGSAHLIRWTGSLDNVPVWTAPRFSLVLGVDVGVRLP
jgi:hypothetical protein